jgi:adenylate cyclase
MSRVQRIGDVSEAARTLRIALGAAAAHKSFKDLVDALRLVLVRAGISVDRIQLPFSRVLGFRHPTLALVMVTWTDENEWADSEALDHATFDGFLARERKASPFEALVRGERSSMLLDLEHEGHEFGLLQRLATRGYRGYFAVSVPMPDGGCQPLSMASREPYSSELPQRIAPLLDLFALAIYGAYRTSQAQRLAEVYIGLDSGCRVLDGEIRRGSTEAIEAGIMFCDIRGFTRLSEERGAESAVELVNEVFAAIEDHAAEAGGEILKFIGDAMLVVFPVRDGDRSSVARAMIATVERTLASLAAKASGVEVGFGCHIGDVLRGNIGTPQRLDYTVMGPAVNLASRLESLCKLINVPAVYSSAVASASGERLRFAGAHQVKGVAEAVELFKS